MDLKGYMRVELQLRSLLFLFLYHHESVMFEGDSIIFDFEYGFEFI